MAKRISESALKALYTEARTFQAFQPTKVETEVLKNIYDTMKFGPTAFNCTPLRVMYLTTPENKERLIPCLDQGNREKTSKAPVVAVLAYDVGFHKYLDRLAPFAIEYVKQNPELVTPNAVHNAWLQSGYFITAARAHGLDCGPMSGFDGPKVDNEFFEGKKWKSFMVVNLGYGDESKNFPRAPRLEFDEATLVL